MDVAGHGPPVGGIGAVEKIKSLNFSAAHTPDPDVQHRILHSHLEFEALRSRGLLGNSYARQCQNRHKSGQPDLESMAYTGHTFVFEPPAMCALVTHATHVGRIGWSDCFRVPGLLLRGDLSRTSPYEAWVEQYREDPGDALYIWDQEMSWTLVVHHEQFGGQVDGPILASPSLSTAAGLPAKPVTHEGRPEPGPPKHRSFKRQVGVDRKMTRVGHRWSKGWKIADLSFEENRPLHARLTGWPSQLLLETELGVF